MNTHFPGICSLLLNLYTGTAVGDQILLSKDYDQWNSNVDNSLTIAGLTLSVVTNLVTTTMIAYKLWYVAMGDSLGPVADHEVILQEPP